MLLPEHVWVCLGYAALPCPLPPASLLLLGSTMQCSRLLARLLSFGKALVLLVHLKMTHVFALFRGPVARRMGSRGFSASSWQTTDLSSGRQGCETLCELNLCTVPLLPHCSIPTVMCGLGKGSEPKRKTGYIRAGCSYNPI